MHGSCQLAPERGIAAFSICLSAVLGTGDAAHMIDNLGGGRGRLPTKAQLAQMIKLVDSLPGG